MAGEIENSRKTRSFGATLVAIAWSFVGLRRKKDFDEDVGGLNPVYVLLAGLLGTALFIGALITVVHFAVGDTDTSKAKTTVQTV